jgi:antitoxin CptB
MTAQLDARRKQILYRASHRGIKEMDILLGGFAAARIAYLDDGEVDALEELMSETDRDLLSWFTGEVPPPDHIRGKLFDAILSHQVSTIGTGN